MNINAPHRFVNNCFSSYVKFSDFSKDSGIRHHSKVVAFFLKRFNMIVEVNLNGKIVFLNRWSVDAWRRKYQVSERQHLKDGVFISKACAAFLEQRAIILCNEGKLDEALAKFKLAAERLGVNHNEIEQFLRHKLDQAFDNPAHIQKLIHDQRVECQKLRKVCNNKTLYKKTLLAIRQIEKRLKELEQDNLANQKFDEHEFLDFIQKLSKQPIQNLVRKHYQKYKKLLALKDLKRQIEEAKVSADAELQSADQAYQKLLRKAERFILGGYPTKAVSSPTKALELLNSAEVTDLAKLTHVWQQDLQNKKMRVACLKEFEHSKILEYSKQDERIEAEMKEDSSQKRTLVQTVKLLQQFYDQILGQKSYSKICKIQKKLKIKAFYVDLKAKPLKNLFQHYESMTPAEKRLADRYAKIQIQNAIITKIVALAALPKDLNESAKKEAEAHEALKNLGFEKAVSCLKESLALASGLVEETARLTRKIQVLEKLLERAKQVGELLDYDNIDKFLKPTYGKFADQMTRNWEQSAAVELILSKKKAIEGSFEDVELTYLEKDVDQFNFADLYALIKRNFTRKVQPAIEELILKIGPTYVAVKKEAEIDKTITAENYKIKCTGLRETIGFTPLEEEKLRIKKKMDALKFFYEIVFPQLKDSAQLKEQTLKILSELESHQDDKIKPLILKLKLGLESAFKEGLSESVYLCRGLFHAKYWQMVDTELKCLSCLPQKLQEFVVLHLTLKIKLFCEDLRAQKIDVQGVKQTDQLDATLLRDQAEAFRLFIDFEPLLLFQALNPDAPFIPAFKQFLELLDKDTSSVNNFDIPLENLLGPCLLFLQENRSGLPFKIDSQKIQQLQKLIKDYATNPKFDIKVQALTLFKDMCKSLAVDQILDIFETQSNKEEVRKKIQEKMSASELIKAATVLAKLPQKSRHLFMKDFIAKQLPPLKDSICQ